MIKLPPMKNRASCWSFLIPVLLISLIACSGSDKSQEDPAGPFPEATAESEWMSLFDGKTLQGWKRYNADRIGKLWKVEDGMIVCYSEGGGEATNEEGGTLITVEQFENFELMLDWKISPGGNSGILYHVVEDPKYSHAYVTGPEYQLVDDSAFPEINGTRKTAASYDMFAPSSDKKLHPPGEWNTAKIVYRNGQVEHWLNGEKVLEFEEGSEQWKAQLKKSKWLAYPGWGQYKKGAIGLQDHGNHTWFKNIRIKKLNRNGDPSDNT